MVEFGCQHPLDDVKGGGIGIAASLDETGFNASSIHGPGDGLAAAMNHDNPHAKGRHEDNVEEQVAERVRMLQHAATEFDHGGRVAELANPAERFDQRVGFFDGFGVGSASGEGVGLFEGLKVGSATGASVGFFEGFGVGSGTGEGVSGTAGGSVSSSFCNGCMCIKIIHERDLMDIQLQRWPKSQD